MHIVSKDNNISNIKVNIRKELEEYNICHSILETEEEACEDQDCHVNLHSNNHHHNH